MYQFSLIFISSLCLFTVAWFVFDQQLSGTVSGLNFSNDNRTVSADGWEHCVALGTVGFSRGVHYWEFTIDRYTADTDPAFGVARIDVARDKMLGKWQIFLVSAHIVLFPLFCDMVRHCLVYMLTINHRRGKRAYRDETERHTTASMEFNRQCN